MIRRRFNAAAGAMFPYTRSLCPAHPLPAHLLPATTLVATAVRHPKIYDQQTSGFSKDSLYPIYFMFLALGGTALTLDAVLRRMEDQKKKEEDYLRIFKLWIDLPYCESGEFGKSCEPLDFVVRHSLIREFNPNLKGWIKDIDPNTLYPNITVGELLVHLSKKGVVRFDVVAIGNGIEPRNGDADLCTQIKAQYKKNRGVANGDTDGVRSRNYHFLEKALEKDLVKPNTPCIDIIRRGSELYSVPIPPLRVQGENRFTA